MGLAREKMVSMRSAEEWWDEWQLRVLVLGSLGVQWFLLLAAPMRKYVIPSWFRACIWLASRGSEPLAIYALATLFNRHARGRGSGSCACAAVGANGSILEVLWAPALLIHIGGQEEMSANDIKDNERWMRQALTVVTQVSIALYALYKSWPSLVGGGDSKLLASAILLFVVGILSSSKKPWVLSRASVKRQAAVSLSMASARRRRKASGWWEMLFTKLMYWRRRPNMGIEHTLLPDGDKLHMIFSDMSLPAASSTLRRREQVMGQRPREQVEVQADSISVDDEDDQVVLGPLSPSAEMGATRQLRYWLRASFGLVYSRFNVFLACYNLLVVATMHVAATALFARTSKQGYGSTDVRMTYAILLGTAAIDVLAESIRQLHYTLMLATGVPALCETLPQYNLLSSARRRMQPAAGCLLRCAARLGLEEEYLVATQNLYSRVTGFVMLDLVRATSGRATGLDLATYRSFTTSNWVLTVELQRHCGAEIRRALRESFDESVLIWHIATNLCIRRRRHRGGGAGTGGEHEECTVAISNYMAHLLNFRPDMLMTGSRRHLLTEALEGLEAIILEAEKWGPRLDDADLLDIIPVASRSERHTYPLIYDACKLSEELMEVQPEETRWELMYRAWVGMLCYSATMCRGNMHAKSLGEGGEFLSFVWLVLSLKGTKTLADKLQMTEPEPDLVD